MLCQIPRLPLVNISGFLPSLTQPQNLWTIKIFWTVQLSFSCTMRTPNLLQNAQECFVVSSIWLYLFPSCRHQAWLWVKQGLWAQQLKFLGTSDQGPVSVDTENHGYGYTSNNSNTIYPHLRCPPRSSRCSPSYFGPAFMERLKRMRSSQSSEHKPSMALVRLGMTSPGMFCGSRCTGQIIYLIVSVLMYKVTFLDFSVLSYYTWVYLYTKNI